MNLTIVFGLLFVIFLLLIPFVILKPIFLLDRVGMSKNSIYGFFVLVALISFIMGILASPKGSNPVQVAGVQTVQSPRPVLQPSRRPSVTPQPSLSPSPSPSRSASPSAVPASPSLRPSPSLSGDKDCKDFKTQAEAQQYFQDRGGSKSNNVDNLDYDHDGTACPHLP